MAGQNIFNEILNRLYPLLNQIELQKTAKLAKIDLIAALSNQESSLPTILNPVNKISAKKGTGIAVSVGGTYSYASSFEITQKGVIKFQNRLKFKIPGKLTKKELFELLTTNILTVIKDKSKIGPVGISFAYTLQPLLYQGVLDGRLLEMSKNREIKGLVGQLVGWEYQQFLTSKYHIKTKVTVANDAICLLLGGDGAEVAGVVGTGLNFAYWEKRSNIAPLKLGDLPFFGQNEVAVNIEAKNFNKIPGSKLREAVDKKSDDPGHSLAEKEAAGAYLYQIFNAGKDKILGKNFPVLSSTDQLNDIITKAFIYPKSITEEQKDKVFLFAERIFHRSAQIVAVELCGILMKIDRTRGVVPVVMEGGIFWRARNYPALVNLYINMILPEVIPSFARLFGSSRRGIAVLARGN